MDFGDSTNFASLFASDDYDAIMYTKPVLSHSSLLFRAVHFSYCRRMQDSVCNSSEAVLEIANISFRSQRPQLYVLYPGEFSIFVHLPHCPQIFNLALTCLFALLVIGL